MAKEKQKWPFCEQGYSHNDLQHGRSITVGRLWLYRGEKADFKPFLNVPIKELEQRLKSSQAEEKKISLKLSRDTISIVLSYVHWENGGYILRGYYMNYTDDRPEIIEQQLQLPAEKNNAGWLFG